MFSNSINSLNIVFRAGCIAAIAAVMLLQAGEVVAQRLQPLDNESESAVSVEAIYGLTKTARKYDDFLTIRERCNTLLKDDLAEKDQKYLNSLFAWAENRLAGKEFENATGLKSVGLADQAQAELEKAIKRYDDLIVSHPTLWRAWMGRAVIHAQHDEYELALKKFRQVVKLDVKNSKARFNCAEILYEQKQYEDAIVEYTKVLADDSTDVQAMTGRGLCYLKLEQRAKAADDFATVVKLLPDSERAESNLRLAGKPDESLRKSSR